MSIQRKTRTRLWISPIYYAPLLIASAIFLFSHKVVFAQNDVLINEFSPASNPEWIELYNPTDQTVSLANLVLFFDDKPDTTQKLAFCQNEQIVGKTFKRIVRPIGSYWLANDGDTIILKREDDIIDTISYGKGQSLKAPTSSQSASRNPDGGADWIVLNIPTPQGEIINFECPAPTPTPTPTFTPTPTLIQPKATYKINEVKDKDGNVLSGVKVYVDGVYVHHYAPETLTFCDECKCDTYVNCGFGSHTIELQKTGYKDWSESKTINAGDNFGVNPIMEKEEESSFTPMPIPTSTPTKKPTPTPILKITPTATENGEILGEEEAATVAFYPLESTPEGELVKEATPSSKKPWLAKIFLGGGFLILFGVGLSFWYTQLREKKT